MLGPIPVPGHSNAKLMLCPKTNQYWMIFDDVFILQPLILENVADLTWKINPEKLKQIAYKTEGVSSAMKEAHELSRVEDLKGD